MKITFTEKIITPPVGTKIAGYGINDVTVTKRDELFMSALALDDGSKKCLILSYDLLGIDEEYIKKLRRACAPLIGGDESRIILGCTHTHCGPHTRSLSKAPELLEVEYLEKLIATTVETLKELLAKEWIETEVLFYSLNCDQNINRRYVGNDNRCTFLPHRPYLEPLCDGVRDPELGLLLFRNAKSKKLEYLIGNFAAHPLAGHSPGLGGHRLSADFPGAFRNYIASEVGCGCMFLSGAAGNMVPVGHETGSEAIDAVGKKLAQEAIKGVISATRTAKSYLLANDTIQSGFAYATSKIRPCKVPPPYYRNSDEIVAEVQMLSIGDVCLVGVPGETLAELGLEIKWHSPFRKTFILYCSTAYLSYLCPGNALVQGGYEAANQYCDSHTGLAIVNAAVEGCYDLYEKTFPDHSQWPENNLLPLVAVKNLEY